MKQLSDADLVQLMADAFSSSKSPVEKLADGFFIEYMERSADELEQRKAEQKKWNSITVRNLLVLPLAEQADFADYVVRKMCEQAPNILDEFADGCFNSINNQKPFTNTSQVGNTALLLSKLPDGPTKSKGVQIYLNKTAASLGASGLSALTYGVQGCLMMATAYFFFDLPLALLLVAVGWTVLLASAVWAPN
jgi:hypothetical protein